MSNPISDDVKNSQCLWIVIPVHNRRELTARCLRALACQETDYDYSVVVVDDGSTDGTSEMIKQEFPDTAIVYGDGNLWWTGSTRKGIDHVLEKCSPNDAVVLLNDDTIVKPDFIQNLRVASEKNPDTLIGSVVLDINQPEHITDGGCQINWRNAKWTPLNHGRNLAEFPDDHIESVSSLTGRGVLIPVEVFDCVGLYNNQHFPQHGDMEFPIRAARAGYRLIVDYRCKVFCHHDLAGDINEKKRYQINEVWDMLTNARSYFNLRERFWFAFKTRKDFVQFVSFYCCDIFRVSFHICRRISL
ncbi:MAG: glycosyltransferase family 2 protein [Burkholderiaceae bacterium]